MGVCSTRGRSPWGASVREVLVGVKARAESALLLALGVLIGNPLVASDVPKGFDRPPLARRLSLEHGLPSSEIMVLAADAAGYLWLGTDAGLVRYDGRRFERWDPVGAPTGTVEQILIDSQDRLWYSITEAGLLMLNPQRELQHHFSVARTAHWPSDDVWALEEDRDGSIWVGMYAGGLLSIEADGTSFEAIPFVGAEGAVHVVALENDASTKSVWVGTYGRGIYQAQGATRVASPVPLAGVAGKQVAAILSGDLGTWLAVRDHGVCLMRLADLSCQPAADELPQLGRATGLAMNTDGTLWVGRMRGLSKRSVSAVWQHFAPSSGSSMGLPARRITAFHVGVNGGLWIGTAGGGLLHLSPLALQADAWVADVADPHAIPDARIASAEAEPTGIWIATRNQGLYRYDSANGALRARFGQRLPSRHLWDVERAGRAGIWVTHHLGVSLVTDSEEGDTHWGSDQLGLGVTDLLTALTADTALVATYGSGLSVVRRGQAQAQRIDADRFPPTQIEDIQRGHGEIWLASEQGLHRFDPDCQCLSFIDLSNERSYALAVSEQGWWVAVAGAINHLSSSASGWAVDQSIAWTGRPPGGIAVDSQGRLWASGPEGLRLLEEGGRHWRDLAPGLGPIARELSSRPFSVDQQSLLLPSETGLLRIEPARLPPAPLVRSLRLTHAGVRRDGEWTHLDVRDAATLLPGDREFSLTLESPLIGEGHALRFQTRVAGLDAEWVEAATGDRVFGTIPPGEYRLQARVWHPASRDKPLELDWSFQMLAPWWQRWPAVLGAAMLTLLLIGSGYRRAVALSQRRHRQQMDIEQLVWAEQNAADKSAFLAHLSHEIRNPLSGLMGLLQLAERDAEAAQKPRLGLIRAAGAQIQALLNDVLTWSRVQQGDLQLSPEPLLVAELADEVCHRWRPLADDRGMPLRVLGDRTIRVLADRLRLGQLFDNLLSNALKFGESGQVLLSWQVTDAALVEISVSDEGPGVPKHAAERIFQARGQSENDGRGLGLGLSIGRQLALKMGGSLVLDEGGWAATGHRSTSGRAGSRFVLTLPLVASLPGSGNDEAVAIAGLTQSAPDRDAGPLGRVVLVEDDPMQRSRWTEDLTNCGYQVSAYADALTALASLNQPPPVALITDLGLPVVDGLELISLVRAQPNMGELPILVMTARAMPADRAAALEAGADGVISKPAESAEVARWLDLRCNLRGQRDSSSLPSAT